MNEQFTEDMQVTNKYMKMCSTLQQSWKCNSKEKAYFFKIMKVAKLNCTNRISVKHVEVYKEKSNSPICTLAISYLMN